MREFEQNGITLHVPDENVPILGLNGWRQACWLTGAPSGAIATWEVRGEMYFYEFEKKADRRCYLMGALPTSAEGEFFRRFPLRIDVFVKYDDSRIATFDTVTVNLCYGAIPMKSGYFNKYPFTFVWDNMEFYFSDDLTFDYKTQYCDVVGQDSLVEVSTHPTRFGGAIENVVVAAGIEMHRTTGAQGYIRDLPAVGEERIFEIEGLDYNRGNADYIPARYVEREYIGRGGYAEIIDGGGWGFFRVDITTMPSPSAIHLTTLEDLTTDLIVLYDSETLAISGRYWDEYGGEEGTGAWVDDDFCAAVLTSATADIGGVHYFMHKLTNLHHNGEYVLHTIAPPYVPVPTGRYMIFSRDNYTSSIVFGYRVLNFVYPTETRSLTIRRITHDSDDFSAAVAAGCLTDLRGCPDLTLKWLDVAGYVWSVPLFLDSATGEVEERGDDIVIGDDNYLRVYSGTESRIYHSPFLNSAELYAIRHITSSVFFAIKGRGVKDMQYNLNPDHWFFAKVNSINYEHSRGGGRIAVTIQCINGRDSDSISKTMYSQNLAQVFL